MLAACAAAATAEYDYVLKVVIAGQMLREYRDEMARVCHSGKPSINGRNQHSEGDNFSSWLEANGVASRTAYRWMDLADRVARLGLGINAHRDYATVIEIDGAPVALSQVLLTPEKELAGAALKFQQGVLAFMEDKTLSEAMRAVADGASAGKRVTLAAGGMTKGGTRGEDRKAFDIFTKQKLGNLTTYLGHKLTVNQKSAIVTAFGAALEVWPRWVLEALAEKCRTELKRSDADRIDREGF